MSERAESESEAQQTLLDAIASLADGVGALLATGAIAVLGFSVMGQWLYREGVIGGSAYLLGTVLVFLAAVILAGSLVMILVERWGGVSD